MRWITRLAILPRALGHFVRGLGDQGGGFAQTQDITRPAILPLALDTCPIPKAIKTQSLRRTPYHCPHVLVSVRKVPAQHIVQGLGSKV